MEDGVFSRGRDIITAEGSIVFVGNIDGDIETIVRTSNLFYPMPKEMDTAFYDRIHAYIPGWEFQKTRDDVYTNHFGLVTDYLAEVFQEAAEAQLRGLRRALLPVRAAISADATRRPSARSSPGSIKLLHPDGQVSQGGTPGVPRLRDGDAAAGERAAEEDGRAGVLGHQLLVHRQGVSGQETFVPVPEMGGGTVIAEGSLPPGACTRSAPTSTDNRLALFLLQSQMNRGSGRIIPLGNLSTKMKEAIKTADAHLKANLNNLGIDRDLKSYDFTIQAINLNQAKEGAETAVAFFLSMVSAILGKPVLDRTVVLGEMSVQGMLLKVNALPERMQLAVESGAKRILIPSENKRDVADVPDAILTAIQWQFYDSPTKRSNPGDGDGLGLTLGDWALQVR